MKKEKNKFVVFLPIFIMLTIMMLISVPLYYFMVTVGRNDTLTPFIELVSLIMLVILPVCLWLWAFVYMLPSVEINDLGITRTLFFMKKHIDWQDCKEIAMISTPTQGWLFFSESEVIVKGSGFLELSKYRLKRDNIFIASNKKVLDIVDKCAPKSLLPIKYKNS